MFTAITATVAFIVGGALFGVIGYGAGFRHANNDQEDIASAEREVWRSRRGI